MTKWEQQIKDTILETDGRAVVADVTRVSRSGMSRWIRFGIVINGELHPLTWIIAEAMKKNYDEYKGLFVRGCGSDMIFHTLYNYYMTAFNLESDKALHLAGNYNRW